MNSFDLADFEEILAKRDEVMTTNQEIGNQIDELIFPRNGKDPNGLGNILSGCLRTHVSNLNDITYIQNLRLSDTQQAQLENHANELYNVFNDIKPKIDQLYDDVFPSE